MPPGTGEAIEAAAGSGWEAVLLVVIVITMITGFVWVWKSTSARESRLATRVTNLEQTIETKLFSLADQAVSAVTANTVALNQASEDSKLTREVLSELRRTTQEQHQDTKRLIANLEASPCIARVLGLFSSETIQRLELIGSTSNIDISTLKELLMKASPYEPPE